MAGERLLQVGDLAPHPPPSELRQDFGVALPGQQRLEHVPPGDPEDVRDHGRELDLSVLEQLLHPLPLPGCLDDRPGQHGDDDQGEDVGDDEGRGGAREVSAAALVW